MCRIHLITFYCYVGMVFFCLPQACSASEAPTSNPIFRHYFPRFQKAMKVYRCKGAPAKRAYLQVSEEIKGCLQLSPETCANIAWLYIRSNFMAHKIFPRELIPIISCYIKSSEEEAYYEERKMQLLQWALTRHQWPFVMTYLAYEMKYSHFYTDDKFFKPHIQAIKNYCRPIYAYKNNFLKKELFLWLLNKHQWPAPTYLEISALGNGRNVRKAKVIAYKIQTICLLKDEQVLLYRLLCFHLLNGQRIAQKKPSLELIKQLDRIVGQHPCAFRLLRLCSSLYWKNVDEFCVVDTTGSLSADIFCAPILVLCTLRGLLGVYAFLFMGIWAYLKS